MAFRHMRKKYQTELKRVAIEHLKDIQAGTDATLLISLVDLFFDLTPKRIQSMKDALKADDYNALTHAAHTLKTSCGTLGANEMQNTCIEIEKLAAMRAGAEIYVCLARLEQLFIYTSEALEPLRNLKQAA